MGTVKYSFKNGKVVAQHDRITLESTDLDRFAKHTIHTYCEVMGITIAQLANELGQTQYSYRRIWDIADGKAVIGIEMAVRMEILSKGKIRAESLYNDHPWILPYLRHCAEYENPYTQVVVDYDSSRSAYKVRRSHTPEYRKKAEFSAVEVDQGDEDASDE